MRRWALSRRHSAGIGITSVFHRALHAQWRVLLNHQWMRVNPKNGLAFLTSDPLYPDPKEKSLNAPPLHTLLVLHGLLGSSLDSRVLAARALEAVAVEKGDYKYNPHIAYSI